MSLWSSQWRRLHPGTKSLHCKASLTGAPSNTRAPFPRQLTHVPRKTKLFPCTSPVPVSTSADTTCVAWRASPLLWTAETRSNRARAIVVSRLDSRAWFHNGGGCLKKKGRELVVAIWVAGQAKRGDESGRSGRWDAHGSSSPLPCLDHLGRERQRLETLSIMAYGSPYPLALWQTPPSLDTVRCVIHWHRVPARACVPLRLVG
jgi:hypothetical protein